MCIECQRPATLMGTLQALDAGDVNLPGRLQLAILRKVLRQLNANA